MQRVQSPAVMQGQRRLPTNAEVRFDRSIIADPCMYISYKAMLHDRRLSSSAACTADLQRLASRVSEVSTESGA